MRRNQKRTLLKIIAVIIMVVLMLAAAAVCYIWHLLDKITYEYEIFNVEMEDKQASEPDQIRTPDDDFLVELDPSQILDAVPTVPDVDISEDQSVINILLIGTDERSVNYSTNARADSMILVSINKKLHTVRLVSLERGIGVPILDGDYAGEYDLLTHVFRWGGADLLVRTVEHCFKVDVKHYVRVNFAAVERIVDTIGGIDLEISKEEAHGLNEWAAEDDSIVHAGTNRVNGETALRFARLRWIDSDWQRVARQRKVILSIVDELKSASLPKLNDLADEVLPLVQTNLSKLEIAELLLYAPNFLKSDFDQMTIPKQGTYGGMRIRNGGGAFAVDYEINNDLLYRFLYEGVSSEALLSE